MLIICSSPYLVISVNVFVSSPQIGATSIAPIRLLIRVEFIPGERIFPPKRPRPESGAPSAEEGGQFCPFPPPWNPGSKEEFKGHDFASDPKDQQWPANEKENWGSLELLYSKRVEYIRFSFFRTVWISTRFFFFCPFRRGGWAVEMGGANTIRENKRFFLLAGHISVTSIHIAVAKRFFWPLKSCLV